MGKGKREGERQTQKQILSSREKLMGTRGEVGGGMAEIREGD